MTGIDSTITVNMGIDGKIQQKVQAIEIINEIITPSSYFAMMAFDLAHLPLF